MALDYSGMTCIIHIYNFLQSDVDLLATSIDVKQLFSQGCLVHSHTCNQLSVASTHALLCLGSWSLMGLVRDDNVKAVAVLDEIQGQFELDKLGDLLKNHT
jgi:hypothetical protein